MKLRLDTTELNAHIFISIVRPERHILHTIPFLFISISYRFFMVFMLFV